MKTNNLNLTLRVDTTPADVFNAINNPRAWWSETIGGKTSELNDEFTYRHKDIHYSKQKLVEVVPGKKLVWLVTDSHLSFLQHKTEWNDTQICFEISQSGSQTIIQFTHVGLQPDCECFDACSQGWGHYVGKSLQSLIDTGKGYPDTKAEMEMAASS